MATVSKRRWTHNGETKEKWVVRYSDHGGKKRMETFDTKREADKARTRIEVELSDGTHTAPSDTLTVSRAMDLYFDACERKIQAGDENAMRPLTLQVRRARSERWIKPLIGSKKLTELSPAVLQDWLNAQAHDPDKPLRKSSITQSMSILRMAISAAQVRGQVKRNAIKDTPLDLPGKGATKVGIPSKPEISEILTLAARHRSGTCRRRDYFNPMLNVAIFAGLRMGEIRALSWSNVDLKKGLIKVSASADIKNRLHGPKTEAGNREVPISGNLIRLLTAWKAVCPPTKLGLVFPSRAGKIVTASSIATSWCRLQVALGWGGNKSKSRYRFHALRHVAASLFIEAGLPPKRIQAIMGHASITMTFDTYGHLFEDDAAVRAAMERIDAAFIVPETTRAEISQLTN